MWHWIENKHGASKIIDAFATYHRVAQPGITRDSGCFLLFLYFGKVLKEIFSEKAKSSRTSIFTRIEDEVRDRKSVV